MTAVPRVSVVIPAYNAAETLAATLRALAGQTLDAGQVEIIVVDDGSTDATAAVAANTITRPVTVLRQRNAGPAVARNAGAARASGDILVFTDADCEPAPEFLAEIQRPFEAEAVSGVQGAYRTRQKGVVPRFAQVEFEDRYAYTRRFPCLDLVATYAAAFRRTVFSGEGGFDTSFPVANNEDTEFSYRLCARGHKLVFAPEAVVYHRHPDSLGKYLRIKFWRAYWRLAACREHPGKVLRDGYTPGVVRLQTALVGLFLLGVAVSSLASAGGLLSFWAVMTLLATSLPFAAFAWRRDRMVGLVAPGLVFSRSVAFAAGAAWAVAARVLPRIGSGRDCGDRP